jgi:signal transduction histidine kinase
MAANSVSQLIAARREAIMTCWKGRVRGVMAASTTPTPVLIDSLPLLLDELAKAVASGKHTRGYLAIASMHGGERFQGGFNLESMVREYGLIAECILEEAERTGMRVTPEEQRSLRFFINDSIAAAAGEFARERDAALAEQAVQHFAFLAHELRTPLSAATMTLAMAGGDKGSLSPTVIARLERSLSRLRSTLDEALDKLRPQPAVPGKLVVGDVRLRELVESIFADVLAEAEDRRLQLSFSAPEDLVVSADERLLRSALSNLVQNAVKFSKPGGLVEVRSRRENAQIGIEVADSCGGLPPGRAEELFLPFVQRSKDRSGFGLGLAITRQAIEAHDGAIQVQDNPGRGCVFVIRLPDRSRQLK